MKIILVMRMHLYKSNIKLNVIKTSHTNIFPQMFYVLIHFSRAGAAVENRCGNPTTSCTPQKNLETGEGSF